MIRKIKKNPKPVAIVFMLMLLFFSAALFSKTVALPELIKPDSLHTDGQQLFITENEKIHIYTLPDLKWIKTFGQAGQGPREFQLYQHSMKYKENINVSIVKNRICIGSLRKMSYFTRSGDFIKEKRLADPLSIAMTPLADGFFGISMDREGFGSWTFSFNLYNSFGRKVKTICSHKKSIHTGSVNKRGLGLVWLDRLIKGPEYVLHEGNIYISGGPGFTIDVYNQNGEMIKKIFHPWKKTKITGADKKRILNAHRGSRMSEDLWSQAKAIIKVPDHYPEFRTFQISEQNIYVQTYKKTGDKTEFLVFDLEGNPIGQIDLPLKHENFIEPFPYLITDGTLYQLYENLDKEEWELHLTELPKQ